MRKEYIGDCLAGNDPMQIAVNATITDTRSTGLGVYTINVVRELALLASSLTVFTSTPEYFGQNGVLVRRVGSSVRPSHGFRGHIARILWSHFLLRRYLRKSNTSVLLSPTPLESILNSPVPQVVVVHDLVPLFFPSQHRRQELFFRFIVPKILRSAARVIADSYSTKEDLIQTYGLSEEKIDVVYIGYERESPQSVEPRLREHDRPYILYVGNLHPHKNVHRLLEAFAVVSHKLPHELLIVGYQDPRFYPILCDTARKLKILDRVIFIDYVPHDQLSSLYVSADVFLFPSLYEGFGMPPLEAMARGVPVVASSNKAVKEVLGDAAEFVDPLDISAIASTLASVVCSEAKKKELRMKGFERIKLYSWKRSAAEVYRILGEVAGAAEIY